MIFASSELSSGNGAVLASGVTPVGGLTVSLGAGDVVRSFVLRFAPLFLLPEETEFLLVPVPVAEEEPARS